MSWITTNRTKSTLKSCLQTISSTVHQATFLSATFILKHKPDKQQGK